MSYILEALRRSEEERHQDQLKNLAGHDGLIHVSNQRTPLWPYLLIGVLALNALVFMWLFFERQPVGQNELHVQTDNVSSLHEAAPEASKNLTTTKNVNDKNDTATGNELVQKASNAEHFVLGEVADQSDPEVNKVANEEIYIDGGLLIQPKNKRELPDGSVYTTVSSKPSVTVASQPINVSAPATSPESIYNDVPNLIDMDSRFQKGVPSLTFNSHIYSDNPDARRVMINNVYLREGQMLSGLEVVMIGETEIVFKKGEALFKRGVMRDW